MPLLAALLLAAHPFAPQAGNVEIPFRKAPTAILVDATVNGHKVTLMFDSGYTGTAIVDSNVDVGKATGQITLKDFVGTATASTVPLKTLAVGDVSIPVDGGMEIVSQPADFTAEYGQHCDGILGFSAFKNRPFTIDFEHNRFILHPASFDVSKEPVDGKKSFLEKLLPIGNSAANMFVTTPSGQKMTLTLDTGNSFYATTHRDVLERVGLWEANKPHKYAKSSGVNSGLVESWSCQMPPLSIFGVPVQSTVWDIIDLPSSSAEGDGTVGFGFLSNFNITMDYSRRRVRLEKWHDPVENTELGDVGLAADYNPAKRRTQIFRVSPDSPAAQAGLKEGDTVLMVDGDDLNRVGYTKFRSLMEGKVGTTVRLAVSHEGELKRVELKRTALVNVAADATATKP